MKGYTIVQYLALLWRFHQATDFIVASRFFVCEVCVAAFFESVASLDSFHIFIRVFLSWDYFRDASSVLLIRGNSSMRKC